MPRVYMRDILVAIFFGGVAPYLWIGAVALSAIMVQAPFLSTISRDFSPALLKIWVSSYFALFGFLTSFICAAIVALPLGYLLRGAYQLAWLIFALIFLAVSIGPGIWQHDMEGVLGFFKTFEMWVFLLGSALFLFLGKRWHQRRARAFS